MNLQPIEAIELFKPDTSIFGLKVPGWSTCRHSDVLMYSCESFRSLKAGMGTRVYTETPQTAVYLCIVNDTENTIPLVRFQIDFLKCLGYILSINAASVLE